MIKRSYVCVHLTARALFIRNFGHLTAPCDVHCDHNRNRTLANMSRRRRKSFNFSVFLWKMKGGYQSWTPTKHPGLFLSLWTKKMATVYLLAFSVKESFPIVTLRHHKSFYPLEQPNSLALSLPLPSTLFLPLLLSLSSRLTFFSALNLRRNPSSYLTDSTSWQALFGGGR